jgi:hypothetical protein
LTTESPLLSFNCSVNDTILSKVYEENIADLKRRQKVGVQTQLTPCRLFFRTTPPGHLNCNSTSQKMMVAGVAFLLPPKQILTTGMNSNIKRAHARLVSDKGLAFIHHCLWFDALRPESFRRGEYTTASPGKTGCLITSCSSSVSSRLQRRNAVSLKHNIELV